MLLWCTTDVSQVSPVWVSPLFNVRNPFIYVDSLISEFEYVLSPQSIYMRHLNNVDLFVIKSLRAIIANTDILLFPCHNLWYKLMIRLLYWWQIYFSFELEYFEHIFLWLAHHFEFICCHLIWDHLRIYNNDFTHKFKFILFLLQNLVEYLFYPVRISIEFGSFFSKNSANFCLISK